jgi:hypothetical protein
MKRLTIIIATLCLVLMLSIPAFARTVTLAWDYQVIQESSITEFRVYEASASGQYVNSYIAIADPADRTVSFSVPDTDDCYFWTLTAYSGMYDNESARSNEVTICIQNGEVVLPTLLTPSPLIKTVRVTE